MHQCVRCWYAVLQGSGSGDHGVSKMMNGNHNPSGSGGSGGSSMAPATVSVPQRIHSVTQQYLGIMNYLSQSHDIWDQADLKAREYKGVGNLLLLHK